MGVQQVAGRGCAPLAAVFCTISEQCAGARRQPRRSAIASLVCYLAGCPDGPGRVGRFIAT
jgi:hypothetical protein